MRNAALVFAACVLVGVTVRAAHGLNDQTEHVTRTLAFDPGGTLRLKSFSGRVTITASVETTAQTGVEMEALTAASVAALTVYDMAKAVDKRMSFSVELLEKVKE